MGHQPAQEVEGGECSGQVLWSTSLALAPHLPWEAPTTASPLEQVERNPLVTIWKSLQGMGVGGGKLRGKGKCSMNG